MNVHIARGTATKWHNQVEHKYDGREYRLHLQMVVDIAEQWIDLIPEKQREVVLSACWLHDTIEDTRKTYNDVKKIFGPNVAEIVYALSNEKGRTRKDRANDKYYLGIRTTPYATFVKLCDRLANIMYSIAHGSDMGKKYKEEYPEFKAQLCQGEAAIALADMFIAIETELLKIT